MRETKRTLFVTFALLGTLLLVVCLRSWVLVVYPHAHFDSDQAVFGLMSKDLVHARAFPMFMYGQRYMLSVSVWFAAPFIAALGTTVLALKLPLLAMNLAVVGMMWVGFRREGFTPWATALCILPFAACSVIVASRLVEHQGGTIEPFFFVMLAYLFRNRAVLLGFTLGIGFLNREFTLIAFIALLMMDFAEGVMRSRWRQRLLSAAVIGATTFAVRFVARFSTDYHGATAAVGEPSLSNVLGFFRQQLPTLMGAERPLGLFNIVSSLSAGHAWMYVGFGVLVSLACLGARRITRSAFGNLSTYCLLIGAGQSAAFMLLNTDGFNLMLVRYILLVLLGAVGVVGWAWREPRARPLVALVVLAMSFSNVIDYSRLIVEYARNPPRHENELLADALVARGVTHVIASYWLAFDISYLTDEAVIGCPRPHDGQRVSRYVREMARHPEVRQIQDAKCDGGEPILHWYLCPSPASAR